MLSPSLSRTGLLRTRLRADHRYATSAFTLTLQSALFGCPLRARVRVYLGATIAPSSLGGRSNRVSSPLGSILSHDHGPTLVGYGSEIASRRIDPSGSCVPVRKAMHTSAQSLTGHLTGQARPGITSRRMSLTATDLTLVTTWARRQTTGIHSGSIPIISNGLRRPSRSAEPRSHASGRWDHPC